ncbi:MAG: ABC transporter permease [Candidatus Cloacimonetes bacterium]|nr:ABC transporter permease [Candidatus Cloacimonadota bacterium]
MKNKLPIILILIVIITLFIASFAIPFFFENNIYEQNAALKYAKPSELYILGNDYLGRDMFVRICYAIRNSFIIVICSIPISMLFGIIYGAYAGYSSVTVEKIMTSIMNIFESTPEFLLAILIMVVISGLDIKFFDGGIFGIIATVIILSWVKIARIIKNETKKIANNDYVLYSELKNARFGHIFIFHILPGIRRIAITTTAQKISSVIFLEAFLSYIGIGIQPPNPSLGIMIYEGAKYIRTYPHLLLFPAATLFIVILLFNILGELLKFENKIENL